MIRKTYYRETGESSLEFRVENYRVPDPISGVPGSDNYNPMIIEEWHDEKTQSSFIFKYAYLNQEPVIRSYTWEGKPTDASNYFSHYPTDTIYKLNDLKMRELMAIYMHHNYSPPYFSADTAIQTMPVIPASFPGGEDSLKAFINKNNLHANCGSVSKVYLSVIIERNGRITHIKLLSNVNCDLENSIRNIIKKMPLWEPAIYVKKKVRSYRILCFHFTS